TNDRLFLRRTLADQIADDYGAARDANSCFEFDRSEATDSFDRAQTGPYRPLGVVLMRLRVAEIHEDAIAHVLGNEPAQALHGLCKPLLIARDGLVQVYRVHARRQRRRTDKVREHHSDLAAFGGVLASLVGYKGNLG